MIYIIVAYLNILWGLIEILTAHGDIFIALILLGIFHLDTGFTIIYLNNKRKK